MDPRLDQFLQTLNRHRVAVGGLAVAVMLGGMAGNLLKPAGLLEEPMAAQLIAGQAQAANDAPPLVLEAFPTNAANRPWVAGTDYTRLDELPRLAASYDDGDYARADRYEQAYRQAMDTPMALPDSTPSAADRAVDAVAQEAFVEEPSA